MTLGASPLEFVSVLKKSHADKRLPFQSELASAPTLTVIRDSLSLPTLLTIGAVLQIALVSLLPIRLAVLPAIVYASYRLLDTSLQVARLRPNSQMADIVPGKVSAQLPSKETGRFGSVPAAQPLVVFHLGARINHPLGFLGPGVKEFGDHFQAMSAEVKARADEFGLLGESSWLGTDRETSNQILLVYYFRDMAGLNKFAHSDVHRKGWDWYNRSKHVHISVFHEAFAVDPGAYESIYVNCPPTLMGATSLKVTNEETGDQEWTRPIVNANKGPLRSQFGRLTGSIKDKTDNYFDMVKDAEPVWDGQR